MNKILSSNIIKLKEFSLILIVILINQMHITVGSFNFPEDIMKHSVRCVELQILIKLKILNFTFFVCD
jgi:hypothetical protein